MACVDSISAASGAMSSCFSEMNNNNAHCFDGNVQNIPTTSISTQGTTFTRAPHLCGTFHGKGEVRVMSEIQAAACGDILMLVGDVSVVTFTFTFTLFDVKDIVDNIVDMDDMVEGEESRPLYPLINPAALAALVAQATAADPLRTGATPKLYADYDGDSISARRTTKIDRSARIVGNGDARDLGHHHLVTSSKILLKTVDESSIVRSFFFSLVVKNILCMNDDVDDLLFLLSLIVLTIPFSFWFWCSVTFVLL